MALIARAVASYSSKYSVRVPVQKFGTRFGSFHTSNGHCRTSSMPYRSIQCRTVASTSATQRPISFGGLQCAFHQNSGLGLGGELTRHEPELDERAGAGVEDGVEHLVDIRERVDRLGQRLVRAEAAAVVRPVDEHVVVEQAVEAHVPGAQHLDGLAEVRLPVRPQRLVRAAGTDALVPHVMQPHLGGCLSVDQQG